MSHSFGFFIKKGGIEMKGAGFRDKVVIVTGGGQGIGRGIARAFAENEARVVIADRDEEAGAECVAQIRELGGKAQFVLTDVTEELAVKNLYRQTMEVFQRVDILVNNAGINAKEALELDSMATWDRVLGVNLRGAYMCAKYGAVFLAQSPAGAIINIASTRALMSEPDSEAYAASKGGLLALTHALAVSLGPRGIRVNAISPGWIETGDWQKSSQAVNPVHSEADRKQHPVGRVGKPEDIAKACLFLTSEEAGFITGTNLVIDGGMTVKMIYAE